MKNSSNRQFADQLCEHLNKKIDEQESDIPVTPQQFLQEARKFKSSQYQYKSILNGNIVLVFRITYRLYCIWLRIQNDILKRDISQKQRLMLEALHLAPQIGAIFTDATQRAWVEQVLQNRNITDRDKAFTLVWTRCINPKKQTVGHNGQNRITDILLFLAMITACIVQAASIFITLTNPFLLIIMVGCYSYMTYLLFLMNKALVFDGNKLIRQIV